MTFTSNHTTIGVKWEGHKKFTKLLALTIDEC